MGQKTHPYGFRLGFTKQWKSIWFATNQYTKFLHEDLEIRKYLDLRLKNAAIAEIAIERKTNRLFINIRTARPAIVIGRKGSEVNKLRDELKYYLNREELEINILEVEKPELEAKLVAANIARQLEQRVSYRRAMKRAIQSAVRMGAKGIKVACSGRLSGSEIARREWYREGRVPLHTLRADIDYADVTSFTASGTIGVKVWIFKGDILEKK
ncbi:MAG: 30S ribosomal protein S3 [Candidatus Cloacimonadota bacterium]|nr:MAG: 30S ribosomal protein S3 [Candidatus Cloacimonadota bacterium]